MAKALSAHDPGACRLGPGESLDELGDSYGAEVQVVKGNAVDALIDAADRAPAPCSGQAAWA